MTRARFSGLGLLIGLSAWAQNVGIGTPNPLAKLHVVGSAGVGQSIMIDNREIKFRGDGVAHFSIFGPTAGRDRLSISRSSSSGNIGVEDAELMSINAAGNVGIGVPPTGSHVTIRNGWSNWMEFQNSTGAISYVFHNPSSEDRFEIGVRNGSTWQWGVMNIRADLANIGIVGINAVPHPSAQLEIASTTRGLLIPRMNTAQRDAIPSPAQGLLIYNTDQNCIEFFDTSADPPGGPTGGFWNSLCRWCERTIIISSSQVGLNLANYINITSPPLTATTYCVYVIAGVTLSAAGNGSVSGAAGNPGLNLLSMPTGSKVILHNYGSILGGGGNGGRGGVEGNTTTCSTGSDVDAGSGGRGGDAIVTHAGCQVMVYNYSGGTIRAGGGGGGGGGAGCCGAGGGGGGGAGTPVGAAGGGRYTECASGFACLSCGSNCTSQSGSAGTATTGGAGGNGCIAAGSCSSRRAGGNGGAGGGNGAAGAPGVGSPGSCSGSDVTHTGGAGGPGGYAVNGAGSGSAMLHNSGTVNGAIVP
ncbi:MAG: hypothetical protein ACUVRD_01245 [Bacteroidia bacterium]